jgi:hypothetical protein
MGEQLGLDWITILSFSDLIFASADLVIAFSLLVYILSHNLTSSVSRSFGAMLTCVSVVYAGDVLVSLVGSLEAAIPWLRLQWVGIAFLPAAYLHFSDTVLRTTGSRTRVRRGLVLGAYVVSLAFLGMALLSDLIIQDGIVTDRIRRMSAGPFFWAFAVYFVLATLGGAFNIFRARRRCLTPTAIRRMTYLSVAFIAPALGAFPFLLVASPMLSYSVPVVLALAVVGNVGVAFMLVLMAYSVAYYGVLSPDRVVKHSLIHFLLRGPFVGICLIVAMLTIPRVESILGLPRDTVLIFAVVGLVVLLELAIQMAAPFIDRLIYRQDEAEIVWMQELDKRLLTTTDVRQFLENLLTALCELLRIRTGFIASVSGGKWQIEIDVGDAAAVNECLDAFPPAELLHPSEETHVEVIEPSGVEFRRTDGFWLLPLRARSRDVMLGVLGLKADSTEFGLSDMAGEAVEALIAQAEIALEDRHLQASVFDTLRKIIPEIERIQRWRGTMRYYAGEPLEVIGDSPVYAPDYQRWVKEALSHYWGGPKLSESPLLKLRAVTSRLGEEESSPVRALRAVLTEAIEALRPAGQRHMTASEWLLYNILEMRYVQGKRVRDIADTLAMSESDLYRKQRVAVDQVARVLAQMENEEP